MTFAVLDIPEKNSELAGWLEQRIVGLDLADVVAGLLVFQSDTSQPDSRTSRVTLNDVLGGQRAAVLERGLQELSEPQLLKFLHHPRLLLGLQRDVLAEGGRYWKNLPLGDDHRRAADDGWTRLAAAQTAAAPKGRDTAGGGTPTRRMTLMRVLSVAAAVMVGVFGWRRLADDGIPHDVPDSLAMSTPDNTQVELPNHVPKSVPNSTPSTGVTPTTGWGWSKPGALEVELPADQYLAHLADSAQAWFNKRPETSEEVRTRIAQFRSGCQTLIEAPHSQLADADRAWLKERCQVWAGKLDENLAALDGGADPLVVRDAADATINKLIEALRGRAEAVA
jgi:hypothetical protein